MRSVDFFLSHHDAMRRRPSIERMCLVHRYAQFRNPDAVADLDFLDDSGQYRPHPLAQLSFGPRISCKGFAIDTHTFLSKKDLDSRSPALEEYARAGCKSVRCRTQRSG